MLTRVARSEARRVALPGRDWFSYLEPGRTPAQNVSMGISIFPAGSRPTGHVHPAEEEIVCCLAGRGRIVTAEATAELEPGVVVLISPGTFHATESDGPESLELACLFSPPVVSGSYEARPS